MINCFINIYSKYLKKGFVWFLYIYYKSFINKLKNLNIYMFIIRVFSSLIGVGIFFYIIIYKLNMFNNIEYVSKSNNQIFWLINIIIILFLLYPKKLSLNYMEYFLLKITRADSYNFYIYEYFKKSKEILFPFLGALFISYLQSNLYVFFPYFIFFYLLENIIFLIRRILFILQLNIKKIFDLLKMIQILLLFIFTMGYFKKLGYPKILFNIFIPYISFGKLLFRKEIILFKFKPLLFICWFVIYLLCFHIYIFILKKNKMNISLVEKRKRKKYVFFTKIFNSIKKGLFVDINILRNNISYIVYKEIVVFKRYLSSLHCLKSLFMGDVFFIWFMTIMIYYADKENNIGLIYLLTIFIVIGMLTFPFTVLIPISYRERKKLWIYKVYQKSFKKFIINKILISHIFFIINILLSLIIVILILGFIGINFFNYINLIGLILLLLFAPIVIIGLAYLIGYKLPESFFKTNGDSLNYFLNIVLIYINLFLLLPFIILVILAIKKSVCYFFLIPLLGIFAFNIIVKFLEKYLMSSLKN